MTDWIGYAVLIAGAAFMYWQAHRTGRDADRAEAAAKRASQADTRVQAARLQILRAAKEIQAHAEAIDHHRRTTGRTVYSYGPDGEIKEDGRG